MSLFDEQHRDVARNEVSLLAKLRHPNIVEYYDHFEFEGLYAYQLIVLFL